MGLFARKISSYFPLCHALTLSRLTSYSNSVTLSPSHALTSFPSAFPLKKSKGIGKLKSGTQLES